VSFDVFVALVLPVTAQTRAPRVNPRVEVSVGAGFASGSDLGDANADLRARDGGTLVLFTTSSKFSSHVPLELRLGFPVSRSWSFEAVGAFSRPELQTSVANDTEGAPTVGVSERIDRYVVDGALIYAFDTPQSRRAVPFVGAGIGWVRQVHEGQSLSEDGVSFRGGGGVKYPLVVRNRGAVRRMGIRADAALIVFSKAVTVGTGPASHLTAVGSLYVAF